MSKTMKVGVIGVGGIARVHFPGWVESPHTEMAAFADVDPEILQDRAKLHGITRTYEDPMDLVRDPDIDIVDICTPNMYHTDVTCAALKAGKHVICEKPLAPKVKDIKKMIAARDASGKQLMTAQHFRFQANSQVMKAALDDGILGDVYHARSWMLRRNLVPIRPGFLKMAQSGGGPCIDIGVHILDLTLWFMGSPKPLSVSGITQRKLIEQPGAFSNWGGTIPQISDVEEFAAAMVRFDNGSTLMLEVSWLLHHNTMGEDMQMWLYGAQAGAHWPSNEIFTSDNKNQTHLNTQIQYLPGPEPHALECMRFAEALANGEPSPVPPEDSLHVMGILDGVYRSTQSNKEVAVRL